MQFNMPVSYDISSNFNLLIYVCTDVWTGSIFFKTADKVPEDPRYCSNMKIIIDIFSAEIETSLSDMHLAIEKNRQLKQNGQKLGQTAILTKSTSLMFLADAFKLMSPEAPSNFGVFNNKRDAVRWLGFADAEKEVIRFWEGAKTSPAEKIQQG